MDYLYNRCMLRTFSSHAGLRVVAFLNAILLLLLVVYRPAQTIFHATGDVALYQDYARLVLGQPMRLPREYPPAAAGLFVLPQLVAPNHYLLGFALQAVVAVWLSVVVVDRLGGRGWWLLLYIGLGAWGTLFFRFDIFVVLVTILAFAAVSKQRWLLAQALLVLGVALKLYPLILMPLVVLWQWRDRRRLPISSALGGGVMLALLAAGMWLAAPQEVVGMLRYHQGRPLEFESLGASVAWLLGPATVEFSYGSFNLLSPYAPAILRISSIANVVLLGVLYLLVLRGRLLPGAAWAVALLLSIAASKVFSTQYLLWVLPLVVLADVGDPRPGNRPRYWWLWALVCLLTSLIYPVGYTLFEGLLEIGRPAPWLMGTVTVRNALLCGAIVLAVRAAMLPTSERYARRLVTEGTTNDAVAP